jgi:hypothetical protein
MVLQMTSPASSMKPVTLALFPTEFDAALVKNLLETRGIQATFAGGYQVIAWDGAPHGTTLVVAEKDLEQAIKIFNEVREQSRRRLESECPQEEKADDRISTISRLVMFVSYVIILVLIKVFTR